MKTRTHHGQAFDDWVRASSHTIVNAILLSVHDLTPHGAVCPSQCELCDVDKRHVAATHARDIDVNRSSTRRQLLEPRPRDVSEENTTGCARDGERH